MRERLSRCNICEGPRALSPIQSQRTKDQSGFRLGRQLLQVSQIFHLGRRLSIVRRDRPVENANNSGFGMPLFHDLTISRNQCHALIVKGSLIVLDNPKPKGMHISERGHSQRTSLLRDRIEQAGRHAHIVRMSKSARPDEISNPEPELRIDVT